ncbi:MAG: 30S ribosomal protein S20 [Candidatus Eisenbacteria sp.]|nr:30S ribosomal protein S20 [Candidatus Eisenbacteria bacterium]
MPQHKSAWKRMRTSAKQRTRNRAVRSQVRHAIRTYREADPSKKPDLLPATISKIDNAVRKGVIKDATANRMKSRFANLANMSQKASA